MPKSDYTDDKNLEILVNYLIKKTNDSNKIWDITELSKRFRQKGNFSLPNSHWAIKIQSFRSQCQTRTDLSIDTTVKLIFGLSAPVNNEFLRELKKQADVVVDDENRIVHYKKRGEGGFELNGKHKPYLFPDEDLPMLKFLAEKVDETSEIFTSVWISEEYKKWKSSSYSVTTIQGRYRILKSKIFTAKEFDEKTKVKMMLALSVEVTDQVLEKLRKNAIVEVDDQNRITKYHANDGSLNLDGDHSPAARYRRSMESRRSLNKGKNRYEEYSEDEEEETDDEKEKDESSMMPRSGRISKKRHLHDSSSDDDDDECSSPRIKKEKKLNDSVESVEPNSTEHISDVSRIDKSGLKTLNNTMNNQKTNQAIGEKSDFVSKTSKSSDQTKRNPVENPLKNNETKGAPEKTGNELDPKKKELPAVQSKSKHDQSESKRPEQQKISKDSTGSNNGKNSDNKTASSSLWNSSNIQKETPPIQEKNKPHLNRNRDNHKDVIAEKKNTLVVEPKLEEIQSESSEFPIKKKKIDQKHDAKNEQSVTLQAKSIKPKDLPQKTQSVGNPISPAIKAQILRDFCRNVVSSVDSHLDHSYAKVKNEEIEMDITPSLTTSRIAREAPPSEVQSVSKKDTETTPEAGRSQNVTISALDDSFDVYETPSIRQISSDIEASISSKINAPARTLQISEAVPNVQAEAQITEEHPKSSGISISPSVPQMPSAMDSLLDTHSNTLSEPGLPVEKTTHNVSTVQSEAQITRGQETDSIGNARNIDQSRIPSKDMTHNSRPSEGEPIKNISLKSENETSKNYTSVTSILESMHVLVDTLDLPILSNVQKRIENEMETNKDKIVSHNTIRLSLELCMEKMIGSKSTELSEDVSLREFLGHLRHLVLDLKLPFLVEFQEKLKGIIGKLRGRDKTVSVDTIRSALQITINNIIPL